jgi:hypothetical protein
MYFVSRGHSCREKALITHNYMWFVILLCRLSESAYHRQAVFDNLDSYYRHIYPLRAVYTDRVFYCVLSSLLNINLKYRERDLKHTADFFP